MKKPMEDVDSPVIDGGVKDAEKPQVSVEQIIIARAQIEAELISMVAQNNQILIANNKMLKELLSRSDKG